MFFTEDLLSLRLPTNGTEDSFMIKTKARFLSESSLLLRALRRFDYLFTMFPLCLVVFPSRVSEASSPYRIRRRQPIRKAPRAPPRLRPTVMHPVRQSHACPYFPAPPPDELPLLPIPEELLLVEPRVLGRLEVDPLIPLEF